jgi:hypothetical protein
MIEREIRETQELMRQVDRDSMPYKEPNQVLVALNMRLQETGQRFYEGTVPGDEKAKRRRKNKAARKARRHAR